MRLIRVRHLVMFCCSRLSHIGNLVATGRKLVQAIHYVVLMSLSHWQEAGTSYTLCSSDVSEPLAGSWYKLYIM